MKKHIQFKFIFSLLALTLICTLIACVEFKWTAKKNNCPTFFLGDIESPRLKKLFSQIQNDCKNTGEFLKMAPSLSTDELNQAYLTAVKNYQYPLAIEFYKLGATDCHIDGQDILWTSLQAANFDLAKSLIDDQYPLSIHHIQALRSQMYIDQENWAYIYNQKDEDLAGYLKFKEEVERLSQTLLENYQNEHPKKKVRFSKLKPYQQEFEYQELFGSDAEGQFYQLVQKVIAEGYTFEKAVHGTQKSTILVDQKGEKIGILKSKNELLAQSFDPDHFAKVPPVVEVNLPDKKNVIIQKWVPNAKMTTEYKPSDDFSNEQLQRIRALDIRLGNSDRNSGNILVTKSGDQFFLVPIDHDLIMHYIPNDHNWQAPYLNTTFSPQIQNDILSIDIEKDQKIMESLQYKDEDILSMKVRTTLLKMAVENQLTLREIDMLFRFHYYDFLDEVKGSSCFISEQDLRQNFSPLFKKTSAQVQSPIEVWKLIGNHFEIYI